MGEGKIKKHAKEKLVLSSKESKTENNSLPQKGICIVKVYKIWSNTRIINAKVPKQEIISCKLFHDLIIIS